MAPHSSTLAWKLPWTEEPGRLQSMETPRVGHDWATSLSLLTSRIGEGNGKPFQCSCLENPRDRGACWAAVNGIAQSQTRLKWLSSSSSNKSSLRAEELMLLNCGVREDSWESFGLQGDQTSPSSVHVEITFESASAGPHFSHLCVRWPASQNFITNCKVRMTWNLLWPVS